MTVAALGVIAAFGLYWFQPWKLFTDNTITDEVPVVAARPAASTAATATSAATATPAAADPTSAAPARRGNRLLATGTFVTHEHPTTGSAQLVELPDGRRQLVLLDLATSDGPDLRVWLTDRAVEPDGWRVFDDGRHVELARLRGNRGNQVYDLPADIDVRDYRSVSIWCKRFAVSFGAAEFRTA